MKDFGKINSEIQQESLNSGKSFKDEQLTEQQTQFQSEAAAFLERITRSAATAQTWPGDRSAKEYRATAEAELTRLHSEARTAAGDPDRLRPLLSRAGEVLAWTQGLKMLAPDRNWFSGDMGRVQAALNNAEGRVLHDLQKAKQGGQIAVSGTTTGKKTALLSISLKDPIEGDSIVVIDPATGNRRRVYNSSTSTILWRPDGASFMAWSSGRGKPLAFMLVKPDGSVSPMQMPFIMEQSWSPDGHKCYFDEGSAFGGTINLYESNPDGSDKRQLTSDGQCSRPQCSPDGRQLAFNMSTIKKSFVGIMNVDGTGARNIAEGSSPCWSPDGKQLAFQTGSQETMAVAVANADGSDMRKILRQSRLNKVAWMPDGKKIVYTFEKQAGDKTINQFGVVAVDGTGSRLLSKPDENCDAVVVAPVGDAIAFVTTSIDNTYRGAWMITDSSGQRRPLTDPIDTDGGWYASWSLPMTPAVAAAWMEGAGQTGPRTAGTATEGVKVSKDDFGSGSIKSFTEAEEAFKRGMAFVPAGQWAKAEPKFREAVRIDPAKGEYQLWLGNACANLQKWDDAERAYRECIRLTPANPQGHSGLAWALAARGQWPQSTAAYQEAIRLDPQNAIFHYYLGITYNWQKKWAEAASAYQEAVRLNPTNSTFHFALGQTYDWQGKWDEAQSAYEEAIKLEPMNAVMRDALGSAYYNQKKLAEAEAQYREAIRLSPTYGGFHANLAGVLFNQNRRDEALVAAKEALRLGFRQHWVYGQLGINP